MMKVIKKISSSIITIQIHILLVELIYEYYYHITKKRRPIIFIIKKINGSFFTVSLVMYGYIQ